MENAEFECILKNAGAMWEEATTLEEKANVKKYVYDFPNILTRKEMNKIWKRILKIAKPKKKWGKTE